MRQNTVTRKLFFLFMAALFSEPAFPQKNFLPGYVVQNDDTLEGFVDYRNWEVNPDRISFKRDLEGETVEFEPLTINSFRVLDELYVSAIIETDISPGITSFYHNDNDPELRLEIDTVFLQTLVEGEKSLYFFKNRVHKPQFYVKAGESFDLLIYKKYMVKQAGVHGTAENKRYLNQLAFYLNDCLEIHSKLKNADYSQRGLEKLFLDYYNCTNLEIRFQKKVEKLAFNVGVVSGFTMTSLHMEDHVYLKDINFDPAISFLPGFFVEVIPPRNLRKWSLYNEINLSSYEVTGSHTEGPSGGLTTTYNVKVGLSYIKMVNMVRYTYPVGSAFVFVGGGISNGQAVSETNVFIKETKTASSERTEEGKAFSEMRKYEQGYVLSLGGKHGRGSLEARFEKGNGMSGYVRVRTVTNRFSVLLGYRL